MRKLLAITLGCSKNTVDTEHILAQVEGKFSVERIDGGFEQAAACSVCADIALINTCGFIGDAKEESVNTILAIVEKKKAGQIGEIYVCGCLSQRYADSLPELVPEVDKWFGARDFSPLIRALGAEPAPHLGSRRSLPGNLPYAYLKISEGCDRRCSYCAIPFIRGKHRSVPIETLVEEAESLAAKGVRELILIAQDSTYYGLDLYRRRALAQLLQRLSQVEGIHWIRIHYSYPADFPEDVLEQMADNPKVCRYLDIPLQHISNKVLDRMHRHVSAEWTRALVKKLREKVPGVALRTTMIVGHPGEGSREFRQLLDFVREARFERLGAFRYSEEEGTYAALNFRDSVRPGTKKRRLDELMSLQREISYAYNSSRIGTVTEVIVDAWSEADSLFVCRSEFESPEVDGEILVGYDGDVLAGVKPADMVGKFMKVRILNADEYDLVAKIEQL